MKNLKQLALKCVFQCDGDPMPHSALVAALQTGSTPRALVADIEAAIRALESDGYLTGNRDELDGSVTWTLTTKGLHKAKTLG